MAKLNSSMVSQSTTVAKPLIPLNCRELAVQLTPSLGGSVGAMQKCHGTSAVEQLLDLLGPGMDETGLVGERQGVEEALYK